ncbi:MAG: alpha-hydroxy-acid oxidizing protein [Brevinematia bacterium]
MKEFIVSIGGGILQERLIREIKNMGFKSIVFDRDENCVGSKIADIFFPISTRDYESILKVLKEKELIDRVAAAITVGTDMSYTVAKINEIVAPYLPSTDVAIKTTDKFVMRKVLKEGEVNVPEFYLCHSVEESLEAFRIFSSRGKKCVTKPVDNMGARGVRRIDTEEELRSFFYESLNYSLSKRVIVEEFIEGEELSVDAIVYKGDILITGVADRIIEYPPYFVETGHIMPTNLPKEIIDISLEEFKKAIKVVGIVNGAAKGDIKISREGVPYIGEIASRLSGGFMSTHTFPYATGINLLRNVLLIHLGKEPEVNSYEYKYVCVERALIPYKGRIKKIDGIEEALSLPGIKDIIVKVKEGDLFYEPKTNLDKAGNVIGIGSTREEAIRNVNDAIRRIKIITEPCEGIELISESEILKRAKVNFNGACYVCKECNGEACRGKMPGIGGVGSGQTFVENFKSLRNYKLLPRYIYRLGEIDTSIDFLSIKLDVPVLVAPVTGTKTNLGGIVDELDYVRWILKGAMYSGTIAMVGDSATPDKYRIGIRGIFENFGNGIGIYKPRSNEEVLKRIKEAEEAGALAVGMDIDGISILTMRLKKQDVFPKSFEDLRYIISSTKLPFIVKGVMTPEDAILAYRAGAKVIMVSNHGGRVNDSLPSTIDVLPSIVKVLKGKNVLIGIDGGFRSGTDVVKALCLGAHFVAIGRPFTIYAFGGGVDGVKLLFDKIKREIEETMKILGVKNLKELSPKMVKKF